MLVQRFIFGILMIVALLALLFGESALEGYVPGEGVSALLTPIGMHRVLGAIATLVVMLLVAFSLLEMRQLFKSAKTEPLVAWPMMVCLVLVAVPFIAGNGPVEQAQLNALHDMKWTVCALALGFIGAGLLAIRRGTVTGAITTLGTTCFILIYLGLLPAFMIRLRVFAPQAGVYLLLYFIATVKICDIGALFTGMALGKNKLIPWLSPGKTIEGLLGGIAASIVVAILPALWLAYVAEPNEPLRGVFPSLPKAVLFGALMAVLGQAGDLIESLLKRDADAKDSGKKIPAFGGLLDVIDSLLPTAPVAWWMLIN